MRASLQGREELTARVQQALVLATKTEAEMVVDAVVAALTVTESVTDGTFTINYAQKQKGWAPDAQPLHPKKWLRGSDLN